MQHLCQLGHQGVLVVVTRFPTSSALLNVIEGISFYKKLVKFQESPDQSGFSLKSTNTEGAFTGFTCCQSVPLKAEVFNFHVNLDYYMPPNIHYMLSGLTEQDQETWLRWSQMPIPLSYFNFPKFFNSFPK